MSDMLSNLLQDMRPRGALFDRSFMRPPWSLRFEEGAPLTLVTLLAGDGWIIPDGEAPLQMGTGDVAVVVGPVPYTIGHAPAAPPQVVVHRADLCTTPAGDQLDEVPDLCCRLDGDGGLDGEGGESSAVLLKGTYQVDGSVCDRVLRGLPRVLVVASDALPFPSVGMIVAELAHPRPGQQAVLDRLLDLLLVSTLREWLDQPDSDAPTWYRAQSDPTVGPALQLMHDDPAHPWTVGTLAAKVAVSRATFARRFAELVGEPPMSYLTCWRLCLAADLLRETDDTVEVVARQVGYANGYALSVAFKRVYGIRPTDHRRGAEPLPAAPL
jgi:AraC-like DNA-binding protein